MKYLLIRFIFIFLFLLEGTGNIFSQSKIIPAAERTEIYFPQLKNKRVGVVANQTSLIGKTHLADSLISAGIPVVRIFSPEHGFRGEAGAGEQVGNYTDEKTGLPVISLYGANKKPSPADLDSLDIVVFDIQSVGVRFYTYTSTMHYMMEACAAKKISFMVLDRPNPIGFYVDGPVLDPEEKSFVGMHPVPVVHGLTNAEYAMMINGEEWLADSLQCDLNVVLCKNYTHDSLYVLPVRPSPNLSCMLAVYLYPSLCLFEGTSVSIGRGTMFPFQVIGHPDFPDTTFSFIPRSIPGVSNNPPWEKKICYGIDLRKEGMETIVTRKKISLGWLLVMYHALPDTSAFFNASFNRLAGTAELMKQIKEDWSERKIRRSWKTSLNQYMRMRKKYLLYDDFKD